MTEQPNDTSMNSEWTDQVFDSLLQEAITGRHPPDLRARIERAWRQEQAVQIPLPTSLAVAGDLVAPPVVGPLAQPARPNNSLGSSEGTSAADKASKQPQVTRRSHAWQVLLVIAASGVLIACAIQWRSVILPSGNSVAEATQNDVTTPEQSNNVALQNSKANPDTTAANSHSNGESSTSGDSEKLTLENVPFANANSNNARPTPRGDVKLAAPKLSDQEIVELIDTQFATLWQQLNVATAERMDDLRLVQLLSKTLAGQELPNTTIAELAELKSTERRERVIAQAIDSQAFARRWASEIAAQWMQGSNVPPDSPPVKRLAEFLASGLAGDVPWNKVVSQVIAGKTAAGDVLVSAVAGGGNHRLAARISGTFMDSSLACVRCHESKYPQNEVNSQDQYWSLVALLMGLDVRSTDVPIERRAIDNQLELFTADKQPSLFFDRPDGTLVAARFVLPNGQPWQSLEGASSPREALASWIGDSTEADQAMVNHVWQVALSRPLVATNAMLDGEGAAERKDLQRLLAKQFQAHGRNLRQLIGWVIRSDVFARDTIKIDQNRWLQAPESDIDKWHLAEVTFAARTSLGQQAVKGGLETSLAAAAKWNQAMSSSPRFGQSDEPSVLAQPSVDPKLKLKTPAKSDVLMPAVGYAVHRGRLTSDQRAYISRLVASEKLTWEQKVEHIVSLSPTQSASNQVKRMSNELLKTLDNPSEVLAELLWAVQNADAS